jgi:hypothetical protein
MSADEKLIKSLIKKGTPGEDDWEYKSPFGTGIIHDKDNKWDGCTFWMMLPSDDRIGTGTPSTKASIISKRKFVKSYKLAFVYETKDDNTFVCLMRNKNGLIEYMPSFPEFGVPAHATKFDYLVDYPKDEYPWSRGFIVHNPGTPEPLKTIPCSIPFFNSVEAAKAYLKSDKSDPSDWNGKIIGKEGEDKSNKSDDVTGGAETDSKTGLSDVEGIAGNEFMKIANLPSEQLENLSNLIEKGWLAGDVGKAILSLRVIKTPGPIPVTADQVVLQSKDISGTTVSGKVFTKQFKNYFMGSFIVNPYYGNFLDYDPYTKIQLYLPYAGIQTISAKDVVGTYFTLSCTIDFLTGNLVYYAYIQGETNRVLYQWNGNCSCEMAITAEDFGRKISNTVANSGTMVSNLVAGNPVGVATGAVSGFMSSMSRDMASCGNVSSNNGFGGIQYPYLIIRRPRASVPTNYAAELGKPSMTFARIGDLRGYTEMADCHVHVPGATGDELSEIEALLKSGVIV